MTAISRSKVKIWVVPVNTASTLLETTSPYSKTVTMGYIAGEIKSYSLSGGESDVESDPVFGGYVDKEKPQSQYEVSFDVIPSLEMADLWESMVYGVQGGVLTSAGTKPGDRSIFIEATDGTNPAAWGFNNCNITNMEFEHPADDNMTKTLNIKFSPTNSLGKPNYIFNSKSRDTTFTGVKLLPVWASF
jgi:hypothetical protein